MTDDPTAIHVDEFVPYPPERVWRAITDPAALASWLMPNDFKPILGHRFRFHSQPVPAANFDGVIDCQVLELEPPHRLRISWAGGADTDTTVTWRLVAEGSGTRIFIDHEGFDADSPDQQAARRIMGGGWRSHILRRLALQLDATPR